MKSTSLSALLVVACVAGCTTTAREKTTYENISGELKEATEKRAALAQQQAVVQSLLPPIAAEMPRADRLEPESRFDITVTNASATQLLNSIVHDSRYSMVVHPAIKDTVSLTLKNVTLREVLNALREVYGYDYRIDGNVIYVMPAILQNRMFKIDYLTSQRRGSTDLRVSSNSISPTGGGGAPAAPATAGAASTSAGVGQSTRVETISSMNFWTELRATLGVFAGCVVGKDDELVCEGGRRVVVSPQTGTVLVRAMPEELSNIAAYLRSSQATVEKQVLIEARILEVALSDGFETGVNWAGFFTRAGGDTLGIGQLTPGTRLGTTGSGVLLEGGVPSTGLFPTPLLAGVAETGRVMPFGGRALESSSAAAGSLFGLAFQAKNFAALMSFLNTQGVVHTLSNPRIATLNNQKAVLKVGSDSLFVTRITGGSTQAAATIGGAPTVSSPTFEVQSFFSGIALDVTPRINQDGSVVLHVRPSVSDVTQQPTTFNLGTLGTYIIPLVRNDISETDSVIRVQDGQIVAIGGLMKQVQSETRQGLPGAGDIPFLGAAFRNTRQRSEKRELVILLKPTVIHGDESWAQNLLETRERVKDLDRGFSWGGRADVFGSGAEKR